MRALPVLILVWLCCMLGAGCGTGPEGMAEPAVGYPGTTRSRDAEDGIPVGSGHVAGGGSAIGERALAPQSLCPPCRQALSAYPADTFVTHDQLAVRVCCSGCARKMQRDWPGYLAILEQLGQTPARSVEPSQPRPVMHLSDPPRLCAPCAAGRCERPEFLSPALQSAARPASSDASSEWTPGHSSRTAPPTRETGRDG